MENRDAITPATQGETREAIEDTKCAGQRFIARCAKVG